MKTKLLQSLELISKEIDKIGNNNCYSFVIYSMYGDGEKKVYSIHTVNPKVKNYSFRFIVVDTSEAAGEFPVSFIIHAMHPKDSYFGAAGGPKQLEDLLLKNIKLPIFKKVIDEIVGMEPDPKEINNQTTYILNSSEGNNIKALNNIKINRPISIKKIVLSSHIGKETNQWVNTVVQTQLIVKCKSKITQHQFAQTISLVSYLSPYLINPIFDMNFIFPSKNDLFFLGQNKNDNLDYTIELSSKEFVELALLIETNSYE